MPEQSTTAEDRGGGEVAVEPVEFPLAGCGVTLRGQLWHGDANWCVLVHLPDQDLDAWGAFPAALAVEGYTVLTFDLPGHGLSDGNWEPMFLSSSIAAALTFAQANGARRRFLITPGVATDASLLFVARSPIDAWVAVSPTIDSDLTSVQPVPTPKLVLVGSGDPKAAAEADRFFRWSTGWTILSAFGATENGLALLHGHWGSHAREQIAGFLKDYRESSG